MQLQLLACALSTEESDEWDCAWCCVVNKERHHPHATSAVVADSTPASCRDASVLVGAKGNGGWRMRFGSDQAPCPDWPIPSPHGSRPRTPRPEGNWATSFFSRLVSFVHHFTCRLEAARYPTSALHDRQAAN